MKKLLVIITFFLTIISTAQSSINKTVGEFSTLKVFDLIEVKMIKSDIDKVVINGKNKDQVKVVNKNGTLKIKMKIKEIFDGSNTSVTLYYTSVETIDANEGAYITLDDVIDQFEIDLKTQEGGKIKAKVDVKYANIRSVTGGEIELSGKAKNQDISLYTGGIYKGEDCISEDSEVAIRAAGVAHVNTLENLKIKIRAGGDVYIYGNPKQVDENKVFGGRVKRM
ncbi:head GIN domain-containing protein [Ichthyenterobacterium sp. W332]|uniref:Head GIN domain-containing protein n=1 Tax=Microcosmobacter mediterraneus TaxID=3075607 RepID=A0ABU2YIL8_9FLAO|nr:head GIN domain-containing protein [Ichthyenterobacterium sp. W332]MDT0558020.1 head GIN domain-containing protein [Ichthyenterobacterium sp. W332]